MAMASAHFSVLRLELDIQSLQNNFYFIGLQQKYWLDKDFTKSSALVIKKKPILFLKQDKRSQIEYHFLTVNITNLNVSVFNKLEKLTNF